MDAKVMKEMLEGNSGLNAEYLTQSVSNDSVSLHFSQFPKFVSLSLRKIYSDVECTYATSLFHFFDKNDEGVFYNRIKQRLFYCTMGRQNSKFSATRCKLCLRNSILLNSESGVVA